MLIFAFALLITVGTATLVLRLTLENFLLLSNVVYEFRFFHGTGTNRDILALCMYVGVGVCIALHGYLQMLCITQ